MCLNTYLTNICVSYAFMHSWGDVITCLRRTNPKLQLHCLRCCDSFPLGSNPKFKLEKFFLRELVIKFCFIWRLTKKKAFLITGLVSSLWKFQFICVSSCRSVFKQKFLFVGIICHRKGSMDETEYTYTCLHKNFSRHLNSVSWFAFFCRFSL